MSIGWFPGHMATARKKAAEAMASTDLVIEVLDARLPGASSNPLIAGLRAERQRPVLKILNKADLADPAATAAWVKSLQALSTGKARAVVVGLSCRKPSEVARVPKLAAALVPHRGTPEKPVRAMVMGIPNVGKSTLINALLRRKAEQTGNQPAITKHQRRHALSDRMELMDTPGLMWPSIRHPSDGLMLAASHAIGENAYIDEEVALFLAQTLLERYPALLQARYRCEARGMDGRALIEVIAARRGLLLKGGAPDYAKAGLVLMHDYRSGALGRISLETPRSRAALVATATSPSTDSSP